VFCVPGVRKFLRVCHIAELLLGIPRYERLKNYAARQLNDCANASEQRSLAVHLSAQPTTRLSRMMKVITVKHGLGHQAALWVIWKNSWLQMLK